MTIKTQTSSSDSDIAIKYQSSNPIIKSMMSNFLRDFNYLLSKTNPKKIIELGAGEGYLSRLVAQKFPSSQFLSTDINKTEYKARKNNLKQLKNVSLKIIDAKKIDYPNNTFDLVICSEVLEHIPNPTKALKEIHRISSKYALLSVPNEPIFHLLNLLRGKYLKTLGNYPEHVNHWSKNSFIKFVIKSRFKVKEIKTPFPWIMLLVKK